MPRKGVDTSSQVLYSVTSQGVIIPPASGTLETFIERFEDETWKERYEAISEARLSSEELLAKFRVIEGGGGIEVIDRSLSTLGTTHFIYKGFRDEVGNPRIIAARQKLTFNFTAVNPTLLYDILYNSYGPRACKICRIFSPPTELMRYEIIKNNSEERATETIYIGVGNGLTVPGRYWFVTNIGPTNAELSSWTFDPDLAPANLATLRQSARSKAYQTFTGSEINSAAIEASSFEGRTVHSSILDSHQAVAGYVGFGVANPFPGNIIYSWECNPYIFR